MNQKEVSKFRSKNEIFIENSLSVNKKSQYKENSNRIVSNKNPNLYLTEELKDDYLE